MLDVGVFALPRSMCLAHYSIFFYFRTARLLGLGTLFSLLFIFALPACWDWAHCFLVFLFAHCPLAGTGHTIFFIIHLRTARFLGLGALFSRFSFFTLLYLRSKAHCFLVLVFSHCLDSL